MAKPNNALWSTAKPNNALWSTTTNAAIPDCDAVVSSVGLLDGTFIGSSFDITSPTIQDNATGERYVLIEELRETKMLLSVITDVLDNIIKDNPDIVHATSIKELVDQQKMMDKLSK